jgi:hemoglobin
MSEPSGPSPYDQLGGEKVHRLAMAFYDAMDAHEPALARLHQLDENGRVEAGVRQRFAMFLAFWLGGPDDYLHRQGHPRLRMRHAHVRVDVAMRDAWLRAMTRAMDAEGIEGPVRAFLDERFAHVANFLRNAPDEPSSD